MKKVHYELMEQSQQTLIPSSQRLTNREELVTILREWYGLQNVHIQVTKLHLPNTGAHVDIPWCHFIDTALLLLTNNRINQPDNYIFSGEDLYDIPAAKHKVIDDFNTGSLWRQGHLNHCDTSERSIDVYAATSMYGDKTHCDSKGKLTLEPLLYTFGIYKRSIRTMPEANMPFGFIPNLDQVCPQNSTAENKMKDYHYIIHFLLSEYYQYQRLGGIKWKLKLWDPDKIKAKPPNQPLSLEDCSEYKVRFQIPGHCLLGDTEGHDKHAGKKTNRTGMGSEGLSARLCRYCDVPMNALSDPFYKIQLTKQSTIQDLVDREDGAGLSELGYKLVHPG